LGRQEVWQTVIVVFDSGVWISAIARRGVPLAAITHGLELTSILTCTELEDEVVRIMNEKFGIDKERTRQRLSELLDKSVRIVSNRRNGKSLGHLPRP
jgi:hypothetical protein